MRDQFPLYAFTGLAREVTSDLCRGSICPAIIGAQTCGLVSLLTQGIADIAWPNGQRVAVGANVFLVAPSGAGKTVIFRNLMEPVEETLASISKEQPQRLPTFLIEDATREAILQSLKDWPVSGLLTDEGGMLKSLLRDSSTLAKLLDGTPLRNSRVSTGRIELEGHRLCMLLMEQPALFEADKVLLGASNGGVGLMNRFLTMATDNMPDSTLLQYAVLTGDVKQRYHQRVQRLLAGCVAHVESQQRVRPCLTLATEAQAIFLRLGGDMRQHQHPASPYARISEYMTRHAERVLRLAGALHVFEHGLEGEVAVETVLAADSIGRWCIEAFRQLTYTPTKFSVAEQDADAISQILFQVATTSGHSHFPLSDVRLGVHNLGLEPQRFRRALPILTGQGRIKLTKQGSTEWLTFYPAARQVNYFDHGKR